MIHLRPYQSALISDTRDALRRVRSVLMVAPTGSGKTAIAAFMAGSARERGRSVWFIAHRDFLLEQTAKTFDKVGIPFGFIAAGRFQDRSEPVQICSVGTLTRRLDRYTPPDVIVWDECHHCSAASYERIHAWASSARHIGLSATPARLDGRGLDKYFDELVAGPTVGELIDAGYLCRYRAFAPTTPHLENVHTRAGDYARDEIAGIMDEGTIIGDMVRHYRERAGGLRCVYYCVSIRHSEHVAATFNAAGIAAQHLDGTSTLEERISAARRFADGSLRVITNVDLFGEGYDLAAQADADVSVEAVGLARPTKSLALHLQQIGRALRPSAGKEYAVILDHAGNCMRHGLPDDEREWTLAGVMKRRAQGTGPAVRQCEECYGVYPLGRQACPYCEHVHVVQGREVEEVAGELAELRAVEARQTARRQVQQARTRSALEAIAHERGYAPGWVEYILRARQRSGATAPLRQGATIKEWKGELV